MFDWKAVGFTLGLLIAGLVAPFGALVVALLLGAPPAAAALLGLLGYVGALWIWISLVPPMPGLLQGFICLLGCCAFIGAGLGCLVTVFRFAFPG
ncbi:MAG: hypothetical protein K0Q72_3330 [Armatimonadetes bacterium]|jgi:hypothetical protein|nr:hypothetical protein [Armatimonadota bacterium]